MITHDVKPERSARKPLRPRIVPRGTRGRFRGASSLAALFGLGLVDALALLAVAAAACATVPSAPDILQTWKWLALAILPGMALANVADALDPVVEFRQLARGATAGLLGLALLGLASGAAGPIAPFLSGLVLVWILALTLMPVARHHGRRLLVRLFPGWGHRTLVLGADGSAAAARRLLEGHRFIGLRPVADFDIDSLAEAPERIGDLAREHGARWSVVAPPPDESDDPASAATYAARLAATFPRLLVLGAPPVLGPRGRLDWVAAGGVEGLLVRDALQRPTARASKRAFDLALASLLLVALALPILCIAAAIRLSSPGPVFYGQRRLGHDGRPIRVWKFRTMAANAEQMLEETLAADPVRRAEWERDHKLRDDPRVTGVGRFLRRTSLDELPQLWNVLRGQMSLVGPRPIVDEEILKYGESFPVYARVRPGITGLWQISGRNSTTYDRRVAFDRHYVTHWSLWLDLFVLLHTPGAVLRQEGAH